MNDERKITKLVRELAGGKPVSEVDPSLYSDVLTGIEEAKKLAIASGHLQRLRKLQKISAEIAKLDAAKKAKLARKHQRAENQKKKETPKPVLESVLDDIASGFPYEVAETYMIPDLIDFCKEKINKLLEEGDYLEAQKYEDISKRLVIVHNERIVEEKQNERVKAITDQLNTTNDALRKAEADYDNAVKEYTEKFVESEQFLKYEETIALREFDEITEAGLPPSSRKYSSALLNLRETEKFLLKSRRFEEAAAIKNEADVKESEEIEDMHQKFLLHRASLRQKLINSYSQKLKCLREKNERVKRRIDVERTSEIDALRRTVENLEGRLKAIQTGEQEVELRTLTPRRPNTGGRPRTVQSGGSRAPKTPQVNTPRTFVTQRHPTPSGKGYSTYIARPKLQSGLSK